MTIKRRDIAYLPSIDSVDYISITIEQIYFPTLRFSRCNRIKILLDKKILHSPHLPSPLGFQPAITVCAKHSHIFWVTLHPEPGWQHDWMYYDTRATKK